jgi:hypothetical protein
MTRPFTGSFGFREFPSIEVGLTIVDGNPP